MSSNISKYIQINEYLLLEYQFNKDESDSRNVSDLGALLLETKSGFKQYIEQEVNTDTGNNFEFTSFPINKQKSEWFHSFYGNDYIQEINKGIQLTGTVSYDTIKIHVLAGYQFFDIDGFLLQINAETNDNKLITLSNYTWNKYIKNQLNKTLFFSRNTLFLGNKSYDKYITLKVPSVYSLSKHTDVNDESYIHNALNIKKLSNIRVSIGSIPLNALKLNTHSTYVLTETLNTEFPVVSIADNFNCYITESPNGDFIEYFGTWDDKIIGNTINDIETGRITLYTSNTPNDNFTEFDDIWVNERKWVLIHDLQIKEFLPGGSVSTTQTMSFTQTDRFNVPNLYRPIIINNDAASFSIEYTCRLMNRMDGSQIIRKSAISSNNPRKYSKKLQSLNSDNILNFSVFNKLTKSENVLSPSSNISNMIKYVKIYYDSTDIILDINGEEYKQGTGPLYLKDGGGVYKFNFYKLIENEKRHLDLSGMYGYRFVCKLSNGDKVTVNSTNSTNMNTTLGQIEFILSENDVDRLLASNNNTYIIQLKNADDSYYTFYQGVYYPIKNK